MPFWVVLVSVGLYTKNLALPALLSGIGCIGRSVGQIDAVPSRCLVASCPYNLGTG